ncbi:hypothetical protein DN051_06645 [Streptomyces cadmiisoli]|uniref:Uncharacterized protein n=1 Tax=Streptomyces cadmiisoli TaxID=2184053 RepID=A0A2Z4IUS3_9ACTN|nr:hypothetical protein DN051_06645 [Streptomyces cadmiisoli]
MAVELPRCCQAQGEGVEVDDVVQASFPAQAQSALAAVEVGSLKLGELAGEEGVDGDERDHEVVARVVEAVERAATRSEGSDPVGGQRGRHVSAAGEGDVAGRIAEDEAFALEGPEEAARRSVQAAGLVPAERLQGVFDVLLGDLAGSVRPSAIHASSVSPMAVA